MPHVTAYRPEIDGLRTIAVLSVVFYHAGFTGFSGGYVGVDIFFVISGYLITAIIAREMAGERFSFAGFYERRIRRILPALFLVSAVSGMAACYWLSPEQLKDFGQSLFATMGFAANIYFYLQSGYFSPDVYTLPMIHMWSLAVEEQFYVLFPILLLVLMRFRHGGIVTVLVLVLLASLALSIMAQSSHPTANFFLTPFRAWELLAGALLAVGGGPAMAWMRQHRTIGSMAEFAGLSLIIVPITCYSDATTFPGTAAVAPVLGTAILIAADAPASFVRKALACRPMVAIGLISYSAYLWHQPLFAFAQIGGGSALGVWTKLALVVVTLALAWVSWRFIEQPFRTKGRFSRTQIFGFGFAGSLILAGMGAALHLGKGFPDRFPASAQTLAETMIPQPRRDECHTEGENFRKPQTACIFGAKKATWAVLGDSHGVELAYALGERLSADGAGAVQLTFSGCPAAYRMKTHNPGCTAWTQAATDWVAGQMGIRDVIVIYRHNSHLFGDQTQSYPALPAATPLFAADQSAEAARRAYMASLEAQLRALTKAGKRVHLVAPVPELPVHVERYVYSRAVPPAFGTDLDWHQRRSAWVRSELNRLAKLPGVELIDPARFLCAGGQCRWRDGATIFYFDDNHLSVAGARRLAQQIVAEAGAAK